MLRYLAALAVSSGFLLSPLYASSADVFFQGPTDLEWETDELAVARTVHCRLQIHAETRNILIVQATVLLDGTSIYSALVPVKGPAVTVIEFDCRFEREGDHYLEALLETSSDFEEADKANNRLVVPFRVPGNPPGAELAAAVEVVPTARPEESAPAAVPEVAVPELVSVPIAAEPLSDLEQEARLLAGVLEFEEPLPHLTLESAVAVGGLEAQDVAVDRAAEVLDTKPYLDVFFRGPDAFQLSADKIAVGEQLSWVLNIHSEGIGEGSVEVVVADGAQNIARTQIVIRAGEPVSVPMQAAFTRPGEHRLTAMINTNRQVFDKDHSNNITEQLVHVSPST